MERERGQERTVKTGGTLSKLYKRGHNMPGKIGSIGYLTQRIERHEFVVEWVDVVQLGFKIKHGPSYLKISRCLTFKHWRLH